jgi:hypothetical protein
VIALPVTETIAVPAAKMPTDAPPLRPAAPPSPPLPPQPQVPLDPRTVDGDPSVLHVPLPPTHVQPPGKQLPSCPAEPAIPLWPASPGSPARAA